MKTQPHLSCIFPRDLSESAQHDLPGEAAEMPLPERVAVEALRAGVPNRDRHRLLLLLLVLKEPKPAFM